LKKLVFVFLFLEFLFANNLKIFATFVKETNKAYFLKNPVIVYKDFVAQAKEGIIKNNKVIYLKKDVIIFYKNNSILAKTVTIYSKDLIKARDVVLVDRVSDVWIKANKSLLKNNDLIFYNMKFSSCCINNPDWFLYSHKGSYNKKSKYLKLYHVILYIDETPVFYLPFYFSSLDKTRRSGFLRPYLGYSTKEGFLYSQPIYIVLSQRADTEITPTIRTLRGKGIYNTFRFVDSPYSFGKIMFGVFRDKDSFYNEYSLAHQKHYGYEIEYKRDKVFKEDKLYLDLKYANDVEFFYLNPYNYYFDTKYLVDKIITSKLNYVKSIGNNYIFGAYFKYFIDTTKIDNSSTIQILPQLNFHKFTTRNYFILNSFDFNYYNYYSSYKKYYQADLSLPLSLYFSFFDDYLKLKITQNFNYVRANYYYSHVPEYFYQFFNTIKIYTSIAKKGSYLHIFNPSIEINIKQFSKLSEKNDLIDYTRVNNSLSLSIFQIFEKGDFYLDHTLRENFDIDFSNKRPLENILNIKISNVSINENNKYDWDLNRIIYNYFKIAFGIGIYDFSFAHLYQFNSSVSQSYTFRIQRSINEYKKAYFEYNYDIENKYVKYFLLGMKLSKKCWQYNLFFKQSRIPVLEEDGVSFIKDNIISFNVNFYPIGGVKQILQLR